MPDSNVDFWFDFGSSYSYPAAVRLPALARAAGVGVRYRPFVLGAIFKAQGWDTSPFNIYPAKGRYMWRDLERICSGLGLPLVRPDPFPQNSLLAARVVIAGQDAPWIADFVSAVYRAEFGEGRQIADKAVIRGVLEGLGIPADPLLAGTDIVAIKARLRSETEEAQCLGVFGSPMCVTADGELFWGNDRLEAALEWASRGALSPQISTTEPASPPMPGS
jgi:2-hydroxychromene-2-carboxylate isomerase